MTAPVTDFKKKPDLHKPVWLLQSSSRVVVCYRTEHYRAAAIHNVERSDVCLEVGCHAGVNRALCKRNRIFSKGTAPCPF